MLQLSIKNKTHYSISEFMAESSRAMVQGYTPFLVGRFAQLVKVALHAIIQAAEVVAKVVRFIDLKLQAKKVIVVVGIKGHSGWGGSKVTVTGDQASQCNRSVGLQPSFAPLIEGKSQELEHKARGERGRTLEVNDLGR